MKFVYNLIILGLFFVIIGLFLDSHYLWFGECAAIAYYKPLTITDRVLLCIVGTISLLVSIKITKPRRLGIIILCGLYFVCTIGLCLYGNDILGMRKEYWPHEYHVQSIEHKPIGID